MIAIALIATLLGYAIVVSQPLAYMFFMTDAQRALSAPAYVELRQSINAVMNRRVPAVYLTTLAAIVLLIVLAFGSGSRTLLTAAAVALACLVTDVALAMRGNIPLNGAMDRWSATAYPDDWEEYRTRWFTVFARRQVVLLVGFVSLLAGAVFR